MDYGVKDSMNMGAAMAPAACDVIYQHLLDFERKPEDYDKIITGDLGKVGKEILIKLLREKGIDIAEIHTDCGIEIFDCEEQGTQSGGSGCGCSAVTLSAHFLKQVEKGALKRILFVPTGALLSTVSFNEGQSVPGDCTCDRHRTCIEEEKKNKGKEEELSDGLYQCILGRRIDLCPCPDFNGKRQKCCREGSWF